MADARLSAELHVWGDVRCPWCWIGFRRLRAATRTTGFEGTIAHRSFLLDPSGPAGARTTIAEAAVNSWGMTRAEWADRSATIRRTGEDVGVEISIDQARQVDSRDAHRLLAIAETHGVDPTTAWEAVFDAHLRRNDDIESHDVLARIGGDLGLDEARVRTALTRGDFADRVRSDHREATDRGVRAVPTFVSRSGTLSGAVGTDELVRFLDETGARR